MCHSDFSRTPSRTQQLIICKLNTHSSIFLALELPVKFTVHHTAARPHGQQPNLYCLTIQISLELARFSYHMQVYLKFYAKNLSSIVLSLSFVHKLL